jgi:hypothetical protein
MSANLSLVEECLKLAVSFSCTFFGVLFFSVCVECMHELVPSVYQHIHSLPVLLLRVLLSKAIQMDFWICAKMKTSFQRNEQVNDDASHSHSAAVPPKVLPCYSCTHIKSLTIPCVAAPIAGSLSSC